MDMIPLKPERKAQLEEYAKRRGHPAAALADAPAMGASRISEAAVERIHAKR